MLDPICEANANTLIAPHLGIRLHTNKHEVCLEIPDVKNTRRNGAASSPREPNTLNSCRSDTDAILPLHQHHLYDAVPWGSRINRDYLNTLSLLLPRRTVGIPRAKKILGFVLPDAIEVKSFQGKGHTGAQATINQLVHPSCRNATTTRHSPPKPLLTPPPFFYFHFFFFLLHLGSLGYSRLPL
jgi:hypothetical protein